MISRVALLSMIALTAAGSPAVAQQAGEALCRQITREVFLPLDPENQLIQMTLQPDQAGGYICMGWGPRNEGCPASLAIEVSRNEAVVACPVADGLMTCNVEPGDKVTVTTEQGARTFEAVDRVRLRNRLSPNRRSPLRYDCAPVAPQ